VLTPGENCGPGSTAFRFANVLWDLIEAGPSNVVGWADDGDSFVVSSFFFLSVRIFKSHNLSVREVL
jgi:hypothetical protein